MSREKKVAPLNSGAEQSPKKTPALDRLEAETLEVCKGILLGLYSARDEKADTVVGWAPDFLEETAAGTSLAWCAGRDKKETARRERARLLHEFAKESTPEWEALIRRVLSR
jgi:hypothetical protein